MKVDELVTQAKDAVHVKRVFGEPYEKDGLTLIPAASVMGGGGGGTGQDPERGEGEGGGVGMIGRPVGAFVVRGGDVSWRPAVDANRAMVVVGVVAVVWLLTRPFRLRARAALKAASAG
jgi:uncharacterized spore protein YtfJ